MSREVCEQWYINWSKVFTRTTRSETAHNAWQACQQLNDKRIADLLALVAKKDALISQCIEENGYLADGDNCTLKPIIDALEITVDDVELVEVGSATHCALEGWTTYQTNDVLEDGTSKLYTIKQKG